MRKENDFSKGVRGKYAKRFEKGTNLVLPEPEVAGYFPHRVQADACYPVAD